MQALKRLPPPLSNDPRILLVESQAFALQGDWAHSSSAAEAAESQARNRGAYLLVAQAELQQSDVALPSPREMRPLRTMT